MTRPPLSAPALVAAVALAAGGAAALPAPPVPHPAPPPGQAVQAVPVFDTRVLRTSDLPTAQLRRARKRMLAGRYISYEDMRALADHGDGLAAFRYAKRLVEMDDPDLLPAAALYFATAAYTGRDYAVFGLLDIVERRDVEMSDKRLEHLENALRALAIDGDENAAEGLLELYASGHPFGFAPDKARELRQDLAAAGDPDAALNLALEALSEGAPDDPARVAGLLETAMNAEDLGTRTTARNLRRMVEEEPETIADWAPTEAEESALADAARNAESERTDP